MCSSGVKEDMEADIEQTEQRREEIMRSSLHEDQFPEDVLCELTEDNREEAFPTEELTVTYLYIYFSAHNCVQGTLHT